MWERISESDVVVGGKSCGRSDSDSTDVVGGFDVMGARVRVVAGGLGQFDADGWVVLKEVTLH